jgi:hypothetical protein
MSLKPFVYIFTSLLVLTTTNFTDVKAIDSLNFDCRTLNNTRSSQINFEEGPIEVIDGRVILENNLQNELAGEITRARAELQNLATTLALQFTEDVGIVYFHKGHNDWSIKFTFGGLVLQTSQEIIFSTDRVFELKGYFEKIDWIEIKGKKYVTTGRMKQLGPILHEDDKKKK